MQQLQDRVAVVTGAASGLGRAMAITLAREGMQVVAADIRKEAAEHVAGEIRREGGRAIASEVDVADAHLCRRSQTVLTRSLAQSTCSATTQV